MTAVEKLEQRDSDEKVVEIELERLRSFEKHPFKVQADSQMIELQESIKKYGILNPLIVRPRLEGVYEIISGHRRKFAAEQLGYWKVPVIIRYMKDDEAVISMVDSNLQRERISPSEKAFAYKMKYDIIKRKTGRRKCGQVDLYSGRKSIEVIGEECGDSPKQVQRYIKITDLIPEILEKVDDGTMGFTPAVQLSYLKKKEQREILEAMDYTQCTPSLSQAQRMKKMSEEGKLTLEIMQDILGEIKQKDIDRVVFKNEQLYRFFPASYTADQMRREILEILKLWMSNYWDK
ncbi:MAG: ParB/RepB/Spo0J family partition protein [Lachnospiraceae bacterium]|nr:ParB/RepB/Spo0J family partition protein [Lachnospiraceae bacterium]